MVAGCPAVEEDTIRNIDVALRVALLVVRIDYRFMIRWALLKVMPDAAMKTSEIVHKTIFSIARSATRKQRHASSVR